MNWISPSVRKGAEAELVDLYRHAKLSHGQQAEVLGISRDETKAVLKRHQVTAILFVIQEVDEKAEQSASDKGLHTWPGDITLR